MCGRYSLAGPNPAQVHAHYPALEQLSVERRYNVAPGDAVAAVTTTREGEPRGEFLRWGLVPSWAPGPDTAAKMINARAETLAERPAYRGPYARTRCLIIADGFYEWQRRGTGRKQAFHITAAERPVFAFAGLWTVWRGAEDRMIRSCTIVTTAANAAIAKLHDRMPVILDPSQESVWLDHGTPEPVLRELLAGLPAERTRVRAVGPAVNDARYDGPECLADAAPQEAPEAPQGAQPSLF